MLRQELRRLFLSPFFYVSVVILLICAFFGAAEDIPRNCDIVYLYEAGCLGYVRNLIPLLAGLAVSDSYLIEIQGGYYYSVMSRTTRLRYCLVKVGTAIFSGVFTVLVMKILYLFGLMIAATILHGGFNFGDTVLKDLAWVLDSVWLLKRRLDLYIGQIILYDCMYASIFPAFCLMVSAFIKNKYVVLLSGFIYNNVMSIIFIGLQWYYVAPSVLDSIGRANLLPHEGFPYRIMVILIYWIVELVVFTRGVWKQTK